MALEKGYSYGFEFDGDRKVLEDVLWKYRGKGFKETPIIEQIEEIASAFSNYDPFEVKLRLCYDACVRRELDAVSSGRFDHALNHTSNFRTGLDCMNYLLDVVNEIANYSEKHYDETIEQIDHEGLIKKYRSEKERCQNEGVSLSQSEIMGD